MKVIVAENCGFCPGVKNAIKMAEQIVKEKHDVYSLGSIIHNPDVVNKLAKRGLTTVDDPTQIKRGTVLIRSHGAAPKQVDDLKARGLDIVDATCVLVKRVQRIASQLEQDGYKVLIIGDKDHPEVKAVVGCVKNVLVITDQADIDKIDKNEKLGIVCQTTKGLQRFGSILSQIAQNGFKEMKVINTLCQETMKRQQSAIQLCRKVEIMFVLGGFESANTRRLVELCKKDNPDTHHLQNWSECDQTLLKGKKIAGVTAGASTPQWIIEEFVKKLEDFQSDND